MRYLLYILLIVSIQLSGQSISFCFDPPIDSLGIPHITFFTLSGYNAMYVIPQDPANTFIPNIAHNYEFHLQPGVQYFDLYAWSTYANGTNVPFGTAIIYPSMYATWEKKGKIRNKNKFNLKFGI